MSDMSPRPSADTLVSPVPEEAPAPKRDRCQDWPLFAAYPYRNADGALLGYILRYETPEPDPETGKRDKTLRPLTLHRIGGQYAWHRVGHPDLPLFDLPRLLAAPDATVMIHEGEKCVRAAARLLPDLSHTTWPGGATAAAAADWTPLAGRDVIIAPDLDAPGRAAADAVAAALTRVGAARIRRLDMAGLARHFDLAPTPGFDIADLAEAGLAAPSPGQALADRPDLLVEIGPLPAVAREETGQDTPAGQDVPAAPEDDPAEHDPHGTLPRGFRLTPEGVEQLRTTLDCETGQRIEIWAWICAPLRVIGYCRLPDGSGWGRAVEFETPEGRPVALVLENRLFAGDGKEARELLGAAGLDISVERQDRAALNVYITATRPPVVLARATQSGWMGEDSFVIPGLGVIPEDRPALIDLDAPHAYARGGSLEGWQDLVADALGNSRLILAVTAGLAGPFLQLLGAESGGVHLHGPSGCGKTTALRLAASIWGRGDDKNGFLNSWHGTASGKEAQARLHCDTLLVQDELGQSKADDLGEMIYMIVNGQGKARATQTGGARPIGHWRTILLSSGELTVAQRLTQARHGAPDVTGGQAVRLLDLPADAGVGLGLFETLHDSPGPTAFADRIAARARTHYGHAGPALVRWIAVHRDQIRAAAPAALAAFLDSVLDAGDDPQIHRALRRFALFAVAGETAIQAGLLPWPPGTARDALADLARLWKAERGPGAHDDIKALARVRAFVAAHGRSRFEDLGPVLEDGARRPDDGSARETRPVHNRAGFRRSEPQGETFYVFGEVFRGEICADLDATRVARHLRDTGVLLPGEGNRLARKVRLTPETGSARFYVLRNLFADGDPDTEAGDPNAGCDPT
ncbi:DUF927 domain-containing protein [Palleronia abyssalis]|uniref:DUF927 domain-containing protein n=1 Tax=Palleronia abyssalis TaxID=1501240 RepID=A0A2R8BZ82_9RHOB|nr:DUF927 domain-containing protein [Palleronia abyssalis]SPJ25449.1 hypothetical protein PAA8504_03300 [Palleronia abyssalis]